jgi:hypothetical protein
MPYTQAELDLLLDREHTIPVEISPENPLPHNAAYADILPLAQTGFTFTPRQLLHAIGCKTAALPVTANDECIKAALLYTYILDMEGDHLSFQGDYGSDLQTARSQEIGIGFMCLLAERYFGIPWDQLGSIPGQGKRFDYRGVAHGRDCIFEAKGTSYYNNQIAQIEHGIEKKNAIHQSGEHFDVELIVSTYVGRINGAPRIVLADPDKSSLKSLADRGNERYYRLKHYCRVLQYIGLPKSAYQLNRFTLKYLNDKKALYQTILEEKNQTEFLISVTVGNDVFLGRWFTDWLPEGSKRYKKLASRNSSISSKIKSNKIRIFQGVRRDIYRSLFTDEPFSQNLLSRQVIDRYSRRNGSRVSVFPDGTIMMFEQR